MRRLRYVVGVLLISLTLLVVFDHQLLPYAVKWLDISEPPVKSDAVFVLLGNEDVRPWVAAALFNAGLAEEVVMARMRGRNPTPQDPPPHEIYVRVLQARGVPEEKIRVLGSGDVSNTMNEIVVLRDYLDDHPDAIVTVVTTNFHTRRTRWSLRRQYGTRADRLRYVSGTHDDFDASDWWLFPYGFEFVLMEYMKLIGYYVLYGGALWYLAAAVGVLGIWKWLRRGQRTQQDMSANSVVDVEAR